MRCTKILFGIIFLMPFFYACNSKLTVNAEWKDITVVYGLLNQNDSVHYFRISKAFLGEGNALAFAKIPDSSNYPNNLDVKLEELNKDSVLLNTFILDTTTTAMKKDSGTFYYPYNLLYRTVGTYTKLNEDDIYRLVIRNKTTNKMVSSKTALVNHFDITRPALFDQASYIPGKSSVVQWTSAVGGKRYQLVIRFHYLETPISGGTSVNKYVDWIAFKDIISPDIAGGRSMEFLLSGEAFYIVVGAHVPVSDQLHRLPRDVEYIFSVVGDDMNTYLEVTEPSTGIVQERPSFSNISNGIGLFSCTYDNRKDKPLVLLLSNATLDSLKTNHNTINRGF